MDYHCDDLTPPLNHHPTARTFRNQAESSAEKNGVLVIPILVGGPTSWLHHHSGIRRPRSEKFQNATVTCPFGKAEPDALINYCIALPPGLKPVVIDAQAHLASHVAPGPLTQFASDPIIVVVQVLSNIIPSAPVHRQLKLVAP